jgi:hypothetical protein
VKDQEVICEAESLVKIETNGVVSAIRSGEAFDWLKQVCYTAVRYVLL